MSTGLHISVRAVKAIARAGTAIVVASTALLTLAQRAFADGPWWLELSRYLPYPLFVLPAIAAIGVSLWLGRWWVC